MDRQLIQACFNAVELMQMSAGYATSLMQLVVAEIALDAATSPELERARQMALERCYDGAKRLKEAMDQVVLVTKGDDADQPTRSS